MGNSRLKPQSVHRIRAALDKVPGALRYEPIPEDAGTGAEPGVAVVISDPGGGPSLDMRDVSSELDTDDGVVDEPLIGFEIPPRVTDAEVRNVLGHGRIGELQRLHEIQGVDALGWYLSFHQLGCQYGIYIRFEAVVWLALEFFRDVRVSFERKVELAFHAVLRHELFHFEVDCMIANWELATGVEVYWSSRKYRSAAGYIELEEGLANAYMLRGFKNRTQLLGNAPGAYAALKRLCKHQPAGYQDGPLYLRTKPADLYLRECSQLSDDYHSASAAPWHVPDEFDTLKLYNDVTQIDWTRCPTILQDRYNLQGLLGINISYFGRIGRIVETEKFQRALKKLDGALKKQWERVKATLAITTAGNGPKFSRWHPGGADCYSVRVGLNFRAHLRYDRSNTIWFAEDIGSHKEMLHG
jgi:hypothetical protein